MPATVKDSIVTLSNGSSSATVSLFGATVLSYTPSSNDDVLFLSSTSDTVGPRPARGGVPICWPVFGPPPKGVAEFEKLKQHGFARNSTWELGGSMDEGDQVTAYLTLEPTPAIQAVYALPFALSYTILLTPSSLTLTLGVTNPSSATSPLSFQALLHAYFRLPANVLPTQVEIDNLSGLSFADKVAPAAQDEPLPVESRSKVVVDGPGGEVDRVYFALRGSQVGAAFGGQGKGVDVELEGLTDVTVWNPGPEKAAKLADMEPQGNEKFVCIEPGKVQDFVSLQPGENWKGGIKIVPRGAKAQEASL